MTLNNEGSYGVPGILAREDAVENDLYWSRFQQVKFQGRVIDGASRDVGNTLTTTLLRAGLLLGEVTSTKKLKEWDPTAIDGTETIFGVLASDINTQRLNSNKDRFFGNVMVGGPLKIERVIVPGTTAVGISGNVLEHLITAQLQGRFSFSEVGPESYSEFGSFKNTIIKAASYTVLEVDNGTLFDTTGAVGAVTFTLPTVAKKGLHYGFFNVADQNMIVAAGTADTMCVFNDAAADSIAYQTASEKIGGMFEVYGNGTLWLVKVSLGFESQTVTIVT